jgi:hypothetical protein
MYLIFLKQLLDVDQEIPFSCGTRRFATVVTKDASCSHSQIRFVHILILFSHVGASSLCLSLSLSLLWLPLWSLGHWWNALFHFSFLRESVGLLGRGISPSQGLYVHKHRTNADRHTYALSGIPTHDLSIRAREDSSCLRPRGHCDRHIGVGGLNGYIIGDFST